LPRQVSDPGQVVVEVLRGLELEECGELRRLKVDPIHLVHRHLPGLEPGVLQRLPERPDEEHPGQGVLLAESGRVDGLEPRQELLRRPELGGLGRGREVSRPVVPALVTLDGGVLRGTGEDVLPVLGEQGVERRRRG
jgi:hypothetical protein